MGKQTCSRKMPKDKEKRAENPDIKGQRMQPMATVRPEEGLKKACGCTVPKDKEVGQKTQEEWTADAVGRKVKKCLQLKND